MLNALRPLFAKLLTPLGQALARTPVTPNMVTVAGTLGVAIGALWLFPTGHLFAGTLVCWGFAMFDMLDGLLARVKGIVRPVGRVPRLDPGPGRRRGGFLRAGHLSGPAGGHQWGLAGVALYCLVAGNMVSYARARAEGLGVKADVGVAERSERLLVALVAAGLTGLGVPFVLAIGLWAVALGSTVTFGQRVWVVRKAVGPGRRGRGADWTEERGARDERQVTREVGGYKRPGGAREQSVRSVRDRLASAGYALGWKLVCRAARILGPRRRSCSSRTSPGGGRARG